MARRSLAHIDSGLYHAVLKGSGDQIIFEDDEVRCMRNLRPSPITHLRVPVA